MPHTFTPQAIAQVKSLIVLVQKKTIGLQPTNLHKKHSSLGYNLKQATILYPMCCGLFYSEVQLWSEILYFAHMNHIVLELDPQIWSFGTTQGQ